MFANYIILFLCSRVVNLIFAECHNFEKEWKLLWNEVNQWHLERPDVMKPILEFEDLASPFPEVSYDNGPAISANQLYHMAMILPIENKPRLSKLTPKNSKPPAWLLNRPVPSVSIMVTTADGIIPSKHYGLLVNDSHIKMNIESSWNFWRRLKLSLAGHSSPGQKNLRSFGTKVDYLVFMVYWLSTLKRLLILSRSTKYPILAILTSFITLSALVIKQWSSPSN